MGTLKQNLDYVLLRIARNILGIIEFQAYF